MLLRLAIAYAAAAALPVPAALVVLALIGLLPRPHRRALGLVPLLLAAAALGHFDRPAKIPHAALRVETLQGWIATPPEGLPPRVRALLEVDAPIEVAGSRLRRLQLASRRRLPPYGTRVEMRGRLRPARGPRHFVPGSEAAWLLPTGAEAIFEVESLRVLPGTGGPAWRRTLVEPIRARVATLLEGILAPREAELLAALVIGKRDGLDAATRDAWSALGVNHILSISGMHVALVAGAVLAAGGNPRRRRGLVALLAAVWGYAALGGLGPTVLRATFMTTWAAIALHLARGAQPLRGLCLAGVALALEMPGRRYDLGLQLSCAATAGLLVAAPAVTRLAACLGARPRWGKPLAWIAGSASLGLAAQAATLPLQIWHFGAIAWISPVANLVMVPLSDAALVVALAALPVTLAIESLGRPLVLVAGGLLWIGCEAAAAATRCGEMRWFLRVDTWTLVAAAAVTVSALGVAWLAAQERRRSTWIGAVAACLACGGFAATAARHPATVWQVEALDVGQGDAIVVTVAGRTWLVDAGDARPVDRGATVVVPHLRRAGVRQLCGLVLSHPHRDHCGGAASVLRTIGADTLYIAGVSRADTEYVHLRAAFPQQPVRLLQAASRIDLAPGYSATVVWPESTDVLHTGPNGCSLVLWAHGGGHPDLYLMGDLEADGEARLAARWATQSSADRERCSVLKAGHHGSRTSSSPAWLAAVEPDIALISVGTANRYGHPGATTLAALAACGATVLRTDTGGAIRLVERRAVVWLERPGVPACVAAAVPVDAPRGAP